MHKFNFKELEKLDNPSRRETMPPLETLKKFNIKENGIFLDVGCGSGYFTVAAAKLLAKGSAIGIDVLDEMLEAAAEKSKGLENIEYKKCGEYIFPINANSVDYVFLCNVLHEIVDKEKYLKEAIRVLKPEGSLCIIEWDKKPMEMGPPVEERIGVEELTSLVSSIGLVTFERIVINDSHYGLRCSI